MMDSRKDVLGNNERLEEINRLQLHYYYEDKELKELINAAISYFRLPVSFISIVLDDAQKFIASEGLTGWMNEVKGSPLEWSLCIHSVESGEPFVVENAQLNLITKNNPLVRDENVRCYAGAPIRSKNNQVLGNFCVLGHRPREFSKEEVEKLQGYAIQVAMHLEARALEIQR